MEKTIEHDLNKLAVFIEMYCRCKHPDAAKTLTTLRTFDVTAIAGKPLNLCQDCHKLLAHAFVKRSNCPMHPKPMCKHCPNHCYHPTYREEIREVMMFAGMRSVLNGRLDYVLHLLF